MMKLALISIFMIVYVAMPVNYENRHGEHYFMYDDERCFPIIWDTRGTTNLLCAYNQFYNDSWSQGHVDLVNLFSEAKSAGFTGVSSRDQYNFDGVANAANSENLLFFGGKFITDCEQINENLDRVDLLADWSANYNANGGDFAGVIAFDEPDHRWKEENNPFIQAQWVDLVTRVGEKLKSVDISFSSLLCRSSDGDIDCIEKFCPLLRFSYL
ncbi:MAG: hypothetical protein GQ565_08625 [Candidatus Aegiribacteria sp.]|nr:hypothetical protein [Candidatus Aegiribacteria sp.]